MLGQTFPRSRSFPSSPLTSLLKHLSSPSDSFLCRCVKELLKCHELSGLLIFPVFSLKRVKGEQNLFKTKNSHSCHQERKTILLLLFFLATFTREPIRVIQFAVALFLQFLLHFRELMSPRIVFVFVQRKFLLVLCNNLRAYR